LWLQQKGAQALFFIPIYRNNLIFGAVFAEQASSKPINYDKKSFIREFFNTSIRYMMALDRVILKKYLAK
jgi:hypothetical protein